MDGRALGAIDVVIVEDHPLYRQALAAAIDRHPALRVIGSAGDGEHGLHLLRELRPDVALLDLGLPGIGGMDVLAALDEHHPTRVLVLSGAEDSTMVYAALAAGAAGYLVKNLEGDGICSSLVAAAAGETVLPRRLQGALASEIRRSEKRARPLLSERELEVLRLAGDGLTTADVGRRLYVSPATVKSHLASIYEKLGVSDRTAAVAHAIRRGLLE